MTQSGIKDMVDQIQELKRRFTALLKSQSLLSFVEQILVSQENSERFRSFLMEKPTVTNGERLTEDTRRY